MLGEKVSLDIRDLGPRLDYLKKDTMRMRESLMRGKARTADSLEDEEDEDMLWKTSVSPVLARALINYANRDRSSTPTALQTPACTVAYPSSTTQNRPWRQLDRPTPENRVDITPNPLYNEDYDDSPRESQTASPPEGLLQRLTPEAAGSDSCSSKHTGSSAEASSILFDDEERQEMSSDAYESPMDVHIPSHRRTFSIDLDNASDSDADGRPAAGCSITVPQSEKQATKLPPAELPQLQLVAHHKSAQSRAVSDLAVSPAGSVQVIESANPAAYGPAEPWQASDYLFPELVAKPFSFQKSSKDTRYSGKEIATAGEIPAQEVSSSPSGCTGSSPDRSMYQEGVDSPNTAIKKQIAATPWLSKVREFILSPSDSDATGLQSSSRCAKSRLSPRDPTASSTPVPSRLASGAVSAEVPIAFGSPLTMCEAYNTVATSKEPRMGKAFLVASFLAIIVLLGSSALINFSCTPVPASTCLAGASSRAARSAFAFSADATAAIYSNGASAWQTVQASSSRMAEAAWESGPMSSRSRGSQLHHALSVCLRLLGMHKPQQVTHMEPASCTGRNDCATTQETSTLSTPYAEWYLALREKVYPELQCAQPELNSWVCACKLFSLRMLLVLEHIFQLAGTQVMSVSVDSSSKYGLALGQHASWVPAWTPRPSAIQPPTTALMKGMDSGTERNHGKPIRSAPQAQPAVLHCIPSETKEAAAVEEPQSAGPSLTTAFETPLPEKAAAVLDSSGHQSASVAGVVGPAGHTSQEAQGPQLQAKSAVWTSSLWAWQFLMPALAVVIVLASSGAACRVLFNQSLASDGEDAYSIGMTDDASPAASRSHQTSTAKDGAQGPTSPARSTATMSKMLRSSTPSATLRAISPNKQEQEASMESSEVGYSTPPTSRPVTRGMRRTNVVPTSAVPTAATAAKAVSTSIVRSVGRSLRSTADTKAPPSVSRTARRMTRSQAASGGVAA